MRYCKSCLMPDTRPGIIFGGDGVCAPCRNYEKQLTTNWDDRYAQLEKICSKYRGAYGKNYDCAISVSGGKDSTFQVYYMKEVMKMNPVLLTVGNIDWTETGRKNLANLSDTFSCDVISLTPNHNVSRVMAIKGLTEIGQPTWYGDALIYAYPYRMAAKLGLHLLVYGENVNYAYGGKQIIETPSAKLQPSNGVIPPLFDQWLNDGQLTERELESARPLSLEECEAANLDPVYLSYFVPWDSHQNYEVAKRWGFRHLGHEYTREGTLEQYNQVDSIGYLLNQWMKYPKFAHASATDMASRWIRAGRMTRSEAIPYVKRFDKVLDQGIVDAFIGFTGMKIQDFWKSVDKWYDTSLFCQDAWGVWHERFQVGVDYV
jgi:N-acetyl sugar amidotransferase